MSSITRPRWIIFLSDNYRYIVIVITISLFFLIISIHPQHGLTTQGIKAIGILFICVVFWVTNVIPLVITSILAVILFPLLGVLESAKSYSLFGNQAVFFILGAFIIASSLMRSGISTRLALIAINRFGKSPRSLLLSVLLFPAFLSFWMSEHAVAAMMYPIVAEIAEGLKLEPIESNYGKSLFLAMAWGCIIGGIATFLGGARAPLAIGILKETTGESIGFLKWAFASIPTVVVMLSVAFITLNKFFPSEIEDIEPVIGVLKQRVSSLGAISTKEKYISVLMVTTIFFWVFMGNRLGLANIALAAVVLLFIFNLAKWKDVEEDVNWGVILMYGGAISLGFGLESTGAASWLSKHTLRNFINSPVTLISVLAILAIFLTEAISNSAVVALLMPVSIALARDFSIDPKVVTLALTIPSGLAFILPMGTPATAIAFSSGFVRVSDTLKCGIIINITAWIIFCMFAIFYWPLLGFNL